MKSDKENKKKRLNEYRDAGPLVVAEIFGAIFFMIIGGFRKNHEYYYDVRFQKRNVAVGYLLIVLFCIMCMYCAIRP